MTLVGRISALRNRRGQALAEFALVLPLVLFFIAGIIEMGRAWNIKQAVTDAAREGARYTVVMDPDMSHGRCSGQDRGTARSRFDRHEY